MICNSSLTKAVFANFTNSTRLIVCLSLAAIKLAVQDTGQFQPPPTGELALTGTDAYGLNNSGQFFGRGVMLADTSRAPVSWAGIARGTNVDAAWKQAGTDEGLRRAFERAPYELENSGRETYRGVNPGQRLTPEFDGREARLSHPEGSVAFHLTGYGYGGRLRKPAHAK